MESSFLLNNCLLPRPTIKSLSNNTKTRFSVSVVQILCECIPLTEKLLSLKVAKKYMPVYCFHGKHFTCWDLCGMLKLTVLGRRIVNRLYMF